MVHIEDRDAFALGFIAMGVRIFYAAAIDYPQMYNAAWISVLAACLLTLPLAFALHYLKRASGRTPEQMMASPVMRVYCAILSLFSIYEAGSAAFFLATSAEYVALETIPNAALLILCLIPVTLGCLKGGQAVAGTAHVTMSIYRISLVIIIIAQFRAYNWRWLTPVLGAGVDTMKGPTISMASMLTGIIPLWLTTARPPRTKRHSLPALILAIALCSTLLMVMHAMVLPSLLNVPFTRWFALDRLLSNGRTPIAMQMVMIPLWYISLTVLTGFQIIAAVRGLTIAIPRLPYRLTVIGVVLIALSVPALGLARRVIIDLVNMVRLPLLTMPIFLYAAVTWIRNRKGVAQK